MTLTLTLQDASTVEINLGTGHTEEDYRAFLRESHQNGGFMLSGTFTPYHEIKSGDIS